MTEANSMVDRPATPEILLTGASGYIGGRLTRHFLEAGIPVRCMGRRAAALQWLIVAGTVAGLVAATFIPADAGAGPPELARLASPIGLDLGARTPEETAVSIAAEIIARLQPQLEQVAGIRLAAPVDAEPLEEALAEGPASEGDAAPGESEDAS